MPSPSLNFTSVAGSMFTHIHHHVFSPRLLLLRWILVNQQRSSDHHVMMGVRYPSLEIVSGNCALGEILSPPISLDIYLQVYAIARAAVLHYINRPRTTYCIKGPHGLTPPLKNVRRKRFRKTAKKQADDNPRSRITQASTSNSRRTHTHTHHTTVVRVVQVVGSGDTRKRNGRCPPFCQPRPIDMLTCARLR